MTIVNSFLRRLSGSELDKEVRKALSAFVDQNKTFSAYDITQAIRKNVGTPIEVVHDDVRPLVFQLMQADSYYEVGSKNFSGITARVFMPKKVVKNTGFVVKKPQAQVQTQTPVPLGVGSLAVTTPVTNSNKKPLYMYPKSEGRITVPASVLKKLGCKPGDYVWVTEHSNTELHVTTKQRGMSGDIFRLDKYGSFRLRRVYTENHKRFKIEFVTSPNETYIRLVSA